MNSEINSGIGNYVEKEICPTFNPGNEDPYSHINVVEFPRRPTLVDYIEMYRKNSNKDICCNCIGDDHTCGLFKHSLQRLNRLSTFSDRGMIKRFSTLCESCGNSDKLPGSISNVAQYKKGNSVEVKCEFNENTEENDDNAGTIRNNGISYGYDEEDNSDEKKSIDGDSDLVENEYFNADLLLSKKSSLKHPELENFQEEKRPSHDKSKDLKKLN